MRIGVDIDGVLLDYEKILKTYGDLYDFTVLNKKGLIDKHEHYLSKRFDWTKEECDEFMYSSFEKLAYEANLVPGAKTVVDMLQKDGHELIIITARGGWIPSLKDIALNKFHENGMKFNKYYWKQSNKLDTAKLEKIDVMIDDSYDICKSMSEYGIKTLYFRDKDMKVLPESDDLKEVSNWGEIYRYIKEMDK